MATTLENRSRRRLVLQLAHPEFYKKRWGWQRMIVRTSELNPKTGVTGTREHRQNCPGSLTLLAGGKAEGLPDAIASVPDVRQAVARGDVRLHVVQPKVVAASGPKPKAKNGKKAKGGDGQ